MLDPHDWMDEAIVRGNRRLSRGDADLLWRMAERTEARTLVEIGSADGCSSLVLGRWAQQHAGRLLCIEPEPRGKWRQNIADWQLEPHVRLVRAASPWLDALELFDGEIDLLFIDGNHKTRWCLVDYHFWAPFVRVGGGIVFHDWTGAGGNGAQVRRAVEIILETDADLLEQVDESTGPDKGAVAFLRKAKR